MTTINVTEGAYKRILKRKQEIEEELQMVIPIARAVDSLVGDEGEGENKRCASIVA